jgi:hypothetical protein
MPYTWGGFVQDIIEGEILREHKDIDMFIENMDSKIDDILNELNAKKYKCLYADNIQMLILEKNNIEIAINPIVFKNETAIWKHIGELGFICFPKEWLDIEYKNFYGLNILTSGYKLEYCLRIILKETNPLWKNKIREKDILAKEYYGKKLLENNIKAEELLEKIWSYNPYWFKNGYKGYEPPVLVIGKDYK